MNAGRFWIVSAPYVFPQLRLGDKVQTELYHTRSERCFEGDRRVGRVLISGLLLVLLVLSACAMSRHREQVRDGILATGLNRNAFLTEWGPPTRTYTATGEEMVRAVWGGGIQAFRGSFEKGKQTYDVWEYDRDITLVFVGPKLKAWKTEMTVPELREWSARRAPSH